MKEFKSFGLHPSLDFRSGQVAKLVSVAPATVDKWCNEHGLQHFKVPPKKPGGNADRRIYAVKLNAFLRMNDMQAVEVSEERQIVIVPPTDPKNARGLQKTLREIMSWSLEYARIIVLNNIHGDRSFAEGMKIASQYLQPHEIYLPKGDQLLFSLQSLTNRSNGAADVRTFKSVYDLRVKLHSRILLVSDLFDDTSEVPACLQRGLNQ